MSAPKSTTRLTTGISEIDRVLGGGLPRDLTISLRRIASALNETPFVEPVWITHDWRCPKDGNHEDGANCLAPWCCSPDCVCKPPPRRREAIEATRKKADNAGR